MPICSASSAGRICRASRAGRPPSSTGSIATIPRASCASPAARKAPSIPITPPASTQAENRLEALRHLFADRLYVELQRHGRPQEAANEAKLIDYAYRRGVPLVATNEPYFATRADYEAQ